MPAKDAECFRCAELTDQEQIALKALNKGEASGYQQRLCLDIIVNIFSRTHDILYVRGSFDQSAFLSGRAFVGQRILKYLNIPLGKLTKQEEESDETA